MPTLKSWLFPANPLLSGVFFFFFFFFLIPGPENPFIYTHECFLACVWGGGDIPQDGPSLEGNLSKRRFFL